jgi:hypothetical protein
LAALFHSFNVYFLLLISARQLFSFVLSLCVQVEARFGSGDVIGARSASRSALIFSLVGIVLGSLLIIATIVTVLVVFL